MFEVVHAHGVDINISTPEQSLQEVEALVSGGGRHYVCFMEGNMLHWVFRSQEVIDVLNGAALCYPDGVAVAETAGWRLGRKVSRVSGPSFLLQACEYGLTRGWRHYFLGGQDGVAAELAAVLVQKYPGLQISGAYAPPFREMTEAELAALAAELSEQKVDLLWVALGGPRQEKWMHRHCGRLTVPVMLGVGAAFDFHTRRQAWAPGWVRAVGLEWLYRACTGGKRVFLRNVICVSHVAVRLLWDRIAGVKYLFARHQEVSKKLPVVEHWEKASWHGEKTPGALRQPTLNTTGTD